jgi:hypothetical protein
MSGLAFAPIHQLKRWEMMKGKEKGYIMLHGHTMRRGKGNISTYFQGTEMSLRFN